MCMGKALAKPQIIKREDPSIKFVDGNVMDSKASPPEIDNTPVIKEKKKVKKQLLDICKSVPSLTIFLLPGGSLLLPILIKFIPKMLPSAFNENLDENE